MKSPKKSEIAEALGVSSAAATRYFKRGCPTYSIAAALEWQRQNVDPTQRMLKSAKAAAPPAAAADVEARIDLAHAMQQLAAIDFASHAERLRAAMRAVPPQARRVVMFDLDVLKRLLPANLHEVIPPDPEAAAAQSDEDADSAGDFLYSLACGELVLVPGGRDAQDGSDA